MNNPYEGSGEVIQEVSQLGAEEPLDIPQEASLLQSVCTHQETCGATCGEQATSTTVMGPTAGSAWRTWLLTFPGTGTQGPAPSPSLSSLLKPYAFCCGHSLMDRRCLPHPPGAKNPGVSTGRGSSEGGKRVSGLVVAQPPQWDFLSFRSVIISCKINLVCYDQHFFKDTEF